MASLPMPASLLPPRSAGGPAAGAASNAMMCEFYFMSAGVTSELYNELAKLLYLRVNSERYLKLLECILTGYNEIKRIEVIMSRPLCGRFRPGDDRLGGSVANSAKEQFNEAMQDALKDAVDEFQRKSPLPKKARMAKMEERIFIRDVYYAVFEAETPAMREFFEVLVQAEGVITVRASKCEQANESLRMSRQPAAELVRMFAEFKTTYRPEPALAMPALAPAPADFTAQFQQQLQQMQRMQMQRT
ncbi:uncharacterized protein V1510DRAFT_423871 [Dipodascopsis tothii]|uniref:uncharacterized protein n=1 Tax=Dipodascopsis tothii TaxID=44089 RepID=UPI0034CDB138